MVSESIERHVRPLQPAVRNLWFWRQMGGAGLWMVLCVAIFVISTLPLLYTVNIAFLQETRFGLSNVRSLQAVIDLFTSSDYLKSLSVTLQIATLVTAFSMFFGIVMALLIGRFALPAKGKLDVLVILPMFISPFTGLIAWISLGSPNTGLLNTFLVPFFNELGFDTGPIVNVWTFGGVIWIMVLFFTPYAYLFTIGSFRAMNGSLEEAARASGATPIQTIWRVTLPMSVPAIISAGLLIFILSAEMYTIPGILGPTDGFWALAYQVYLDATHVPVHAAHAASAGTVLLIVAVVGVLLQRRAVRMSARFASIGGKGHPTRPLSLGRWRWAAFAFVGLYVSAASILPLLALLLSSFMKYSSGTLFPEIFTFEQYEFLFTLQAARLAFFNTIILAVLTGAICVLLGFVIAYRDVRAPSLWIAGLTLLAIMPVAVPGLVYGIGLQWLYLKTPLYGTIWILLFAFIAKLLPYSIMVSRSGIQQINGELEESARVCGARPFSVLRIVTMPLIKTTLVGVLFFVMLMSIKELSAAILLQSSRGLVLSVVIWNYVEQSNYQFAAAAGLVQTIMIIGLVTGTRALFGVKLENSLVKS